MTIKQTLLRWIYPLFVSYKKVTSGKAGIVKNESDASPTESFYGLSIQLIKGQKLDLSSLKGKKVLIVNTASDCGYTAQYEELKQLQDRNKNTLVVIAVPSNDFKEQESGTDEEIATFCKVNYQINFPLLKKATVRKGSEQHPVYQWLTNKRLNGWNNKSPEWNFSKYLVDEKGVLRYYFPPAISPIGKEITEAINRRYQ